MQRMNAALSNCHRTRTALLAFPLPLLRLPFGATQQRFGLKNLYSMAAAAEMQVAQRTSNEKVYMIPETDEPYGFTRRRKDAWSEQDISDLPPSLRPDHAETLDLILRKKIYLLQSRRGYRANTDSQLLAYFAWSRIGKRTTEPRSALRMLDLGAGNGLVSILFGRAYGACEIHQVELQGQLANRAARNLQLNDMKGTVLRHDLADGLPSELRYSVDVVVMNPPFYEIGNRSPPRRREKLLAHMETSANIGAFLNAAAKALSSSNRHFPPRVFIVYDVREVDRLFHALSGAGLRVEVLQKVKHSEDECPSRILIEAVPRREEDNAENVHDKDKGRGGNHVLPTLCLHPPGSGLYKYNECMEQFLDALPVPYLKIGQLRP